MEDDFLFLEKNMEELCWQEKCPKINSGYWLKYHQYTAGKLLMLLGICLFLDILNERLVSVMTFLKGIYPVPWGVFRKLITL